MDEVKLLESLSRAFGNPEGAEEAVNELKAKKQEKDILENFRNLLTLKQQQVQVVESIVEQVQEPVEITEENLPPFQAVAPQPEIPTDFVTAAARSIKAGPPKETPTDTVNNLLRKELDAIKKSIVDLHAFASQMSNMGGGGEVNLRWLDDVDRNAIADGQYLRYDASSKKFTFDAGFHNAYYGSFYDTTPQYSDGSNASIFKYNTTESSFGINVNSNGHVIINNPGVYNAIFTAQLENSGQQIDSAVIWLRLNGVDVPDSAGIVDVTGSHGGGNGAVVAGWNYFITTANTNEYFEIAWTVYPNNTHVFIPYKSANNGNLTFSKYPGVPSVTLTVNPVKVDSY